MRRSLTVSGRSRLSLPHGLLAGGVLAGLRSSGVRIGPLGLAVAICCVVAAHADATTRYNVRLSTAARTGQSAGLAIDFVTGASIADSLAILDFALDGKAGPIVSPGVVRYKGGPVKGDLLNGVYPAPMTMIENGSFYNQVSVPVDSLGTSVSFAFQLPEPLQAPLGIADELSFFYLGADGMPAFGTLDPLGTNALFAVSVTGVSGGDLNVFSPMMFIPPDTLALDLGVVGVSGRHQLSGRLQLYPVRPNPSRSDVTFAYEIPGPGGSLRIRVFDVNGRLVAEPFRGRREPGTWTTVWNGRDIRGRTLAAGVYVVQLEMGGQSLVRRIVFIR